MTTMGASSSEKLGLAAILIFGGAVLVAALFLAITYQYKLVYFSAFVPALAAFTLMSYLIWQCRIHGRWFSMALGLIFGLLSYGAFQGMSYLVFRQISMNSLAQTFSTHDDLPQRLDQRLTDQTGASGFWGYLLFEMQRGTLIRSSNMIGPANDVRGTGVLVYWLYDAAVIVAGAIGGVWWAKDRAYSTHMHAYYGRIRNVYGDFGMERLGWVEQSELTQFLQLLDAQHFEQAGTLLQAKRSRTSGLELKVERCEGDDTVPILLAGHQPFNRRSATPVLIFRRPISLDAYHGLTAFAPTNVAKSRFNANNEWLLNMGFVIGFISLIMLAYGAFQGFIKG